MVPRTHARMQPRDLLLCGRPDAVTDHDLLTLVVGERAAKELHGIADGGAIPQALWRMAPEDVVSLPGMGQASAARLFACLEVSRRAVLDETPARPSVSTPEDVVALCGPQLRGADREHFWALVLNTKNRLIKVVEVSVGSLNASIVHPRELFKEAVRAGAASVIVVHNHPSGDPSPSGADIQLTRRLVRAGDVLGIEVLDHVVLGENGEYASLRDLGLM